VVQIAEVHLEDLDPWLSVYIPSRRMGEQEVYSFHRLDTSVAGAIEVEGLALGTIMELHSEPSKRERKVAKLKPEYERVVTKPDQQLSCEAGRAASE
jgi:hypothetical protein